ncbi:hypothetical protein C9933_00995 [Methylophaga nitratireducenticrescens]|nr:hypothetical protein C9933_00995 [Methylophaga nitratireducenticrescens]
MNEQNYSQVFLTAVNHLLKVEGGYVDDPTDNGGETNYGISKRQYPQLNIIKLTMDEAIYLYHRDYWLANKLDQLPIAYACFLFDALVNHRQKTAIKFLQQALRATPDGILGPQTRAAAKQFSQNIEHTVETINWCLSYRADFYHDLVVDNPSQERFILGWMRRLFSLQQFILTEVIHGTD